VQIEVCLLDQETGSHVARFGADAEELMRAALGLIGTLLLVGGVAAEPGKQTLEYAVVRKDEQIGTHKVEIRRKDAETTVDIATQVAVKVAFITAYSFQQSNTEKWVNGRLVSFRGTTDDNGTRSKLEVTAGSQGLRVQADGKTTTAPAETMPASVWNHALMEQSVALNTVDGSLMPIKVTSKGAEEITVQSRKTKTRRYNMKGVFDQELWYDEQGRLVQMKLRGRDGSDVFYRLLQATPDTGPTAKRS
jgi:hypothetical protein